MHTHNRVQLARLQCSLPDRSGCHNKARSLDFASDDLARTTCIPRPEESIEAARAIPQEGAIRRCIGTKLRHFVLNMAHLGLSKDRCAHAQPSLYRPYKQPTPNHHRNTGCHRGSDSTQSRNERHVQGNVAYSRNPRN